MKRETPRLKNSLKLSRVLVVFAVLIDRKLLLSERLEAKILLKALNVHTVIDQPCQILHGVI